jgi:arylsulfatase A-like enzyme
MATGRYPHSNGLVGLTGCGFALNDDEVPLQVSLGRAGWHTALVGFQHERPDPRTLGYHEIHQPRDGPPYGSVLVPHWREFLRRRRSEARPFFASAGFYEAHRVNYKIGFTSYPPVPAERTAELPAWLPADRKNEKVRADFGGFLSAIEEGDRAAGELLAALDEAGLRESTLVIFATDHGCPFPRAKCTLFDPGIEIALMMRWPGRIAPGRRDDQLVSNVDLFPSLHAALGLPCNERVQGRGFWPPGGETAPRDAVFAEYAGPLKGGQPQRMVRTAGWKLIRNFTSDPALFLPRDIEGSLTRATMGDEHLTPRPPLELYDLKNDPLETRNLAGDPACAARQAELSARLDAWMRETNDSPQVSVRS